MPEKIASIFASTYIEASFCITKLLGKTCYVDICFEIVLNPIILIMLNLQYVPESLFFLQIYLVESITLVCDLPVDWKKKKIFNCFIAHVVNFRANSLQDLKRSEIS